MGGRGAAICNPKSLLPLLFSSRLAPIRRISHLTVRMASPPDPSAPPPPSSAPFSSASSASSAIDFLSLCHRLKTTERTGWVQRGVRKPESVADHMYRMGIMSLVFEDIPGINRDRCVKMALVHDIAEGGNGHLCSCHGLKLPCETSGLANGPKCGVDWDGGLSSRTQLKPAGKLLFLTIVGDITPSDGVPKLEKSRREREALDYMCKVLGGGSRAKEIGELWMEYEDNSSPEAKLVKDFDKLAAFELDDTFTVLQVEMILQALEYEDGFAYTTKQGIDLEEFFESTAGKFKTDVGKAWASEIVSRRKRGK
ncbi:hypothetical protein ZIOFF_030389 [Zingiber officinale]|uniref:5'-deoxynucleotidase n=1 Tax=Zingiber officinale TaxID=94328 RepID=A0A8J5LF65_ZINOF|nr:hypothetical protein ZIOFF_030389 [Zingiber officinale]